VPRAMGTQHPNIVPYQVFHASDRPFILGGGNDRIFARTCDVLGHPEWANDPDFATNEARVRNRDRIVTSLSEVFSSRTAAQWLSELDEAGVPCSPIRSLDEVFASPEGAELVQTVHDAAHGDLKLVADPIRFDGETLPLRMPPPSLGEHSDEIRSADGRDPE
jgi:crotonobetainyl-CoA:carnitine CoA-transferase CaiB-like acyl-CoA transferase